MVSLRGKYPKTLEILFALYSRNALALEFNLPEIKINILSHT